jgi:hypothetical protein
MLQFGCRSRGDEALIDFLLGQVFETAATFLRLAASARIRSTAIIKKTRAAEKNP